MKKRSLFAAVAMLIVSAIVLTSATYAWFQANGAVKVESFSAKTDSQGGGLVLSTTGNEGTWKSELKATDYQAEGLDNVIVVGGDFIPVSGNVGSTGKVTFTGGSLAGTTFTVAESAPSEGFVKYTTYVKSPNVAGTIEVTPTLTSNSPFVYYSAVVESTEDSEFSSVNYKAYAAVSEPGATTYDAITGGTTAQDSNADGIISSTEGGSDVSTAAQTGFVAFNQANAKTALSFSAKANTAYRVIVYCWAEGQDAECVAGAAATNTSDIGLAFNLAA